MGETPAIGRSPENGADNGIDVYFSADVETDGPVPGPFSLLSFAIVYAGRYDGERFQRPPSYDQALYKELRPISDQFEQEALRISGLDRHRLSREGEPPERAMTETSEWVRSVAGSGRPILVAYPLGFDWMWLYWYFVRYSASGSPFNYSAGFDIKTAVAVKGRLPISRAGRTGIDPHLRPIHKHTHHALDDAIAQAEIFANVLEWDGVSG